MAASYLEIWDQRIGHEAADVLKQRAWLASIPFGLIGGIVWMSFTLKGDAYGLSAAVWGVALFTVYLYGLKYFNRRLATAMSKHLGFDVDPRNLPRFRSADLFDEWLAATKTETSNRELRLHGWSTGISLPPK